MTLCGASAATFLRSTQAEASSALALSLGDLVKKSASVVVVTGLAKSSSWQVIGGNRRIVTDTRVRIEELVRGADPSTSELLVRTLGGQVGNIGQLVEGEAELALGEPSLTFMTALEPTLFGVTAMAQGHYPVVSEARGRVLRANPRLPALFGSRDSAVSKLSGRLLGDGLALVRAARQ